MNDRQVKLGETVILIPSLDDAELRHNSTKEVPAIVAAVFGPKTANVRAFADGEAIKWLTSVHHQSETSPGSHCFRFQDEPTNLPDGDPRIEPGGYGKPAATQEANTA